MAKYYSKIKNKMDYPFLHMEFLNLVKLFFQELKKNVKNYFPEEIDYKLSIREGVPHIKNK